MLRPDERHALAEKVWFGEKAHSDYELSSLFWQFGVSRFGASELIKPGTNGKGKADRVS